MYTNQNPFFTRRNWTEKLGEVDIFEYYVTGWIMECKLGGLTKEDVLNVTKKVAKYRGDSSLVLQIEHRIGLS